MIEDIEGWGSPENLGLRREGGDPAAIASTGGAVALLAGVTLFLLGLLARSGELALLAALDSPQGWLAAGLCMGSGTIALIATGGASSGSSGS